MGTQAKQRAFAAAAPTSLAQTRHQQIEMKPAPPSPPVQKTSQIARTKPHQVQVHRVAVLLDELGGRQQQRGVVAAELHDERPIFRVGVEVALAIRASM